MPVSRPSTRSVVVVVLLLFGTGRLLSAASGPTALERLTVGADEQVHPIEGGEADIDGAVIRRFTVGDASLTVTYRNQTDERARPRYQARVYNRYGLLLQEVSVGGGLFNSVIDAGEVESEDLHPTVYPLDLILQRSAITVPEDWREGRWLVLGPLAD